MGFSATAQLQEFVVIACSLMLRVKAMLPPPSRNLIILFKGEYVIFFIYFYFLFLNLF